MAISIRPIENSTWSRWVAPYSRRYRVRSRTTPTSATTTTTSGSVARKGTPARLSNNTHTYPPSIAKAPCARLTKPISPSVTDSPTLIRNSSIPEAMPSKITVMTGLANAYRSNSPLPPAGERSGVRVGTAIRVCPDP